ncbi:histidine phosphatase family protein [Lysobacter fragariae]
MRHGDTGRRGFRGRIDDALVPEGWQQMRAAVAGVEWDAIFTSPLRRCSEFARELAVQRAITLHEDERLIEYDSGEWQSLSMEELADLHGDALTRFWADPVANPPPGGESMSGFQARLTDALDAIARTTVDAASGRASPRVLVVTHGGAIRLLRCLEAGRALQEMSAIDVPHASIHRMGWPAMATNHGTQA